MNIEIVETKHYDGHVHYAVRLSNADSSLIIDCVNKLEAEQLQYQLKARVCTFGKGENES